MICRNCGAALAPDARFCPRCGSPVTGVPPRPAANPAQQKSKAGWWIVPLVVVGLILVAWLLLAVLPLDRKERRVETKATETIAEGTTTAPPATGTIIDLPGNVPPATDTTATIPTSSAPATVPPVIPPPVIIEERVRTPPPTEMRPAPVPTRPAPSRPSPAPPAEPARSEISDAEASYALLNYIASHDTYDRPRECIEVRSLGYSNVGYGFSVWDSCVRGGGARRLGQWRVDAKTREVFRRNDAGRYVKP